jgi:hypothetical protein
LTFASTAFKDRFFHKEDCATFSGIIKKEENDNKK